MALSSTTLVNVTEDAEVRLVSLLADAAPPNLLADDFRDKCSNSISGGNAAALIQTIIDDAGAVAALTLLPSDQATAAVSILAALMQRLDSSTTKLAQSLADRVTSSADATVEQKIHILSIMYNMQSVVAQKCSLLAQMIRLAGTGAPHLLAPDSTLGRLLEADGRNATDDKPILVTWLDSWQVPPVDRRELFRTIAEMVPLRKQRFLLLLCETFEQGDDAVLDAARQASIGAIQDPVTHFAEQRDLLTYASGLQKKEPFLYELVRVFQQGKIADYTTLVSGKEAQLKQLELNHDDCCRYMRILSLCSLAAEHEEIPYSIISETLQLESTNQVESCVIAAINSGLLQAKMDQLKECVMVERCAIRQFHDIEQWKALQSRLQVWKKNVGGILDTLKESQASTSA